MSVDISTCPTCKSAFTPKKYWQKFCCTVHQRLWYYTAQQLGVEMVQKGKMVAEFEAMLLSNLKEEEAKDPEVQRRDKEKREEKKELRREREKTEKGAGSAMGELIQSGKTKKTGKKLRENRLDSTHGNMNREETWRSWIERNMNTEKEKKEFLQEHLKQKETFIDLDQRIGETNADFRERKRQEKVL